MKNRKPKGTKIIQNLVIPSLNLDFQLWVNPPMEMINPVLNFWKVANKILVEDLKLNRCTLGQVYAQVGLRERNLYIKWLSILFSQGPNNRWSIKRLQTLADEIDIHAMGVLIDCVWNRLITYRNILN